MTKEQKAYDYHRSVLYQESLDALHIHPDGVYVDCTFGGGGHSKGILEQLSSKGRLIAFDQDEDAQKNIPADNRFLFVPQNFRHLQRFLRLHDYPKVDGILADLGVSSHQFDVGERGFSIRFDGPLDMRMDKRATLTAAEVLQQLSEEELVNMFSRYGEVSNSKTLASFIVDKRKSDQLQTVSAFKNMIAPMVKGNPNKYLAQVFQALRIQVNNELGALEEMLEQVPQVLKGGARVAIITFHSLEDRLVKNFFKKGSFQQMDDHPFLNSTFKNPLTVITKKPITPKETEIKENKRSRSAKLRIAEKNEF